MKSPIRLPAYLWSLLALVSGILLGGGYPGPLQPVATATAWLIRALVRLVPLLIFAALSPSIATLIRRGLAGRFAASVILWTLLSSSTAGLFGLVSSSLIFDIPFSTARHGSWTEAFSLLSVLKSPSGASLPLIAIVGSILLGAAGARVDALYTVLSRIERAIAGLGPHLAYALIPLVLLFGISLGVKFGARLGMGHYLSMTLYTAALCLVWFLFYAVFLIGYVAEQPLKKVLTVYALPTAVFAAGTCSSLATLPVNLDRVKRYGVRDEVADFVVPFGAVANMNGSALMYVAYAPFVISHIYSVQISWMSLLMVAPALVIFTVAAPGLPVGMGTALWTATLFSSLLDFQEPLKTNFVVTWLALSGGLPDMFRTATNTTGDGLTAIAFDHFFDRFFKPRSTP